MGLSFVVPPFESPFSLEKMLMSYSSGQFTVSAFHIYWNGTNQSVKKPKQIMRLARSVSLWGCEKSTWRYLQIRFLLLTAQLTVLSCHQLNHNSSWQMQLCGNLMSKWKKKAEDQIAVNRVHQMTLIEKKTYEGKRSELMPEKLTLPFYISWGKISKINSILKSVAGTQTHQVSL